MSAEEGNPAEIRKAIKRLRRALDGVHVVDGVSALGTVLGNIICDCASSLPDADRGLDAVTGDIRNVLRMRFPQEPLQ